MKNRRFHENLKNFLIELGEKEGFKAFSGDSECLDVRLKRSRVEYKPDVIWRYGASCYVFEIAFTEDWRAVIGEFALAWLKDCSKFLVFRLVDNEDEKDSEYDLLNNLFSILGKKFENVTWYFWIFTKAETRSFEKAKRAIRKQLKEWRLIS